MAINNLPSREDYIANQITDIDSCDICLMPFNAEHLPARLSGTNSCHHVFGSNCIKGWLNSGNNNANKCPTCRARLFASNTSDDDDDDTDDDDQDDQRRQASSAVLHQPLATDYVFTYDLQSLQGLDDYHVAYFFTLCLFQRLNQPNAFNNDRIKACIEGTLRDCANYHNFIIVMDGASDWAQMITAVKVLIGEWMVTGGRPTVIRCLQILTSELPWNFPNFNYGPEPLVSAHNFSGRNEVGPFITERYSDLGTVSIHDIQNYGTAHYLLQGLLSSFTKGVAYDCFQIRARIELVLMDMLRLKGIHITIQEEWCWRCLVHMISRMLVLWNATGLQPSPLWGIRRMAKDFEWKLDGHYTEELLLAESCFGKSHDGGNLIDHANGVYTTVTANVNQQQNQNGNRQQHIDIRSITSRNDATQLLQGLINYIYRNTEPLDTQLQSSQIQRLVNTFLLDEFNVAVPRTVWPGLTALVQELRRLLSMDKDNITTRMGWWMKEMKEVARWGVKLSQEEILALMPGCNGLYNCGRDRCGCRLPGNKVKRLVGGR